MQMFNGAKVLVTGGTGLIGRPLVEMLINEGAQIRVVSLDDPSRAHPQTEFLNLNLMVFEHCLKACTGMDFVFHLAGIKGSPAMAAIKPASFFVPTMAFNLNMMEAARQSNVKRYLFTSSVGVYSPAEIFKEDDVWETFPSEHDKFAGWAKRMGELQAEAYKIEYGWDKVAIVRPANAYGPFDNFDPANAMVIPSLIRRALSGENPFVVWGDGSAVRDFIYADDVARGMIVAMREMTGKPINLGSGHGVSIKEVVDIIIKQLEHKPRIEWDATKPSGDKKRLMDITRASALGFKPSVSLEEGIGRTMQWYLNNFKDGPKRYNVFTERQFYK
jgi:GDP-L-fucose synthase